MSKQQNNRREPTAISRRALARQIGLVAGITLLPRPAMAALVATPRQVEGPFYPVGKQAELDADLTLLDGHRESASGETILVRGRVLDRQGAAVEGAVVDVWQANHYGRYSHPRDSNTAPLDPHFQGWAVIESGSDGSYGFKTIKPGAYYQGTVGQSPLRCRHIHFKVSKPGGPTLTTQMYFEGDPLIADDPVISRVPEERRDLLIAKVSTDPATGLPQYGFDIVLDT